jgi:hypothetical protein
MMNDVDKYHDPKVWVRNHLDLNLKGNHYSMSPFINKNIYQNSKLNKYHKTSHNTKQNINQNPNQNNNPNIIQTIKCTNCIFQTSVLIYYFSEKFSIALIHSWKPNEISPIFFSFIFWGNLLRPRPTSESSLPIGFNTASLIRLCLPRPKLPTMIDLSRLQDTSMMNDVD